MWPVSKKGTNFQRVRGNGDPKKKLGVKAIGDRNSTYLQDPPVQKMKVLAQFYDPRPPVPVFLRSSRSLTPSPFLSDYYDKVKLPAMDL